MSTVLVAGSTGMVGGEICRILRSEGRAVRALVRSTSDPAQMRLPDLLEESLNQANTFWEARKSEDALVHLQRSIDLAKQYGYL